MPTETVRVITQTPRPRCPHCGSPDAIRIAYGYPSFGMSQAANRGEIRLGGCVIGPESPDFECLGCGAALPWIASDDDPDD